MSLVEVDHRQYLKYNFPNIDIALLRGTYADQDGNIYMTHEAHLGEGYSYNPHQDGLHASYKYSHLDLHKFLLTKQYQYLENYISNIVDDQLLLGSC